MTVIVGEYFDWLCQMVNPDGYEYGLLLNHLFDTQFDPYFRTDESRTLDGMSLRYEFAEKFYQSDADIHKAFRKRPVSVLEVMVGLAKKLEDHILCNNKYGDRTSKWFQYMLESLGLDTMYDGIFDEIAVDDILERFLDHEYTHDGEGGLFHVPNSPKDMRSLDIWYQAMNFLNLIEEDNCYE